MFRQLEHTATFFRLAACCWLFIGKHEIFNILVPGCILNFKSHDYKGFLPHFEGKLDG